MPLDGIGEFVRVVVGERFASLGSERGETGVVIRSAGGAVAGSAVHGNQGGEAAAPAEAAAEHLFLEANVLKANSREPAV